MRYVKIMQNILNVKIKKIKLNPAAKLEQKKQKKLKKKVKSKISSFDPVKKLLKRREEMKKMQKEQNKNDNEKNNLKETPGKILNRVEIVNIIKETFQNL